MPLCLPWVPGALGWQHFRTHHVLCLNSPFHLQEHNASPQRRKQRKRPGAHRCRASKRQGEQAAGLGFEPHPPASRPPCRGSPVALRVSICPLQAAAVCEPGAGYGPSRSDPT